MWGGSYNQSTQFCTQMLSHTLFLAKSDPATTPAPGAVQWQLLTAHLRAGYAGIGFRQDSHVVGSHENQATDSTPTQAIVPEVQDEPEGDVPEIGPPLLELAVCGGMRRSPALMPCRVLTHLRPNRPWRSPRVENKPRNCQILAFGAGVVATSIRSKILRMPKASAYFMRP